MITSTRIPIIKRCGYFFRWYYNGWHYWQFYPGVLSYKTEGEKYRTYGTRAITASSGPLTLSQVSAVRTILNTTEVYLYSDSGWAAIRIETGSAEVKNNTSYGYEVEIKAIIGSRMLSVTGFSPVIDVPTVAPSIDQCEVVIGTQVWMCKNYHSSYPGSRVYDNNEANRAIYGGLYTFDMIRNPGFCPDGWHVPTEAEWQTLIDFAGGLSVAGAKLRQTGTAVWEAPNTGATDDYGFSAVGGGVHGVTGDVFYAKGFSAYIWTASNNPAYPNSKVIIRIDYNSDALAVTYFESAPNHLASVRLIKDTAAPTTIFSSWFLPSRDESDAMHVNLYLEGVGDLGTSYWTSSEFSSTHSLYLDVGDWDNDIKGNSKPVRACRSFIADIGLYSLRDIGPGGGLIFYIDGATYYETAPSDQGVSAWSNVANALIGTTGTAIGTGLANTAAIINQAGHTASAAKLCDDLVI